MSIVSKLLDWIRSALFIVLSFIITFGMFYGVSKLNNADFLEYAITTTFVLAGLTFFAVFNNKNKEKFLYWTAQSCYALFLSGFFLLAHLVIPNMAAQNGWVGSLLGIVIYFNPLLLFLGWVCFLVGIFTLLVTLHLKINSLDKK